MTTILLFVGLVAFVTTLMILVIERANQKELLASSRDSKEYWHTWACELQEANNQLKQDLKDAVELERLIKDEERDHHELFLEFSEGQRKYWNKRYSALLADIRDATSLKELRKWGKADDL